MRRFLLILLALVIPATLHSDQAYGCSFSWKKGHSPEEVKRSPNIRRIQGTYTLEKVIGTRTADGSGSQIVYDGSEVVYNARLLGTIISKSGRKWKTINEPMPEEIGDGGGGCVDYINSRFPVPEADAEGLFWIEVKPRQGRHKVRFWEGQYLPDSDKG